MYTCGTYMVHAYMAVLRFNSSEIVVNSGGHRLNE